MANTQIDKEYLQFLFSKPYSIIFSVKKSNEIRIGYLKLYYESLELATTAFYYFLFRLRDKEIDISFEITKEHELIITLNIKDYNFKISNKINNYNHLDFANFYTNGDLVYGMYVFISFSYPENKSDLDTLWIKDENINSSMMGSISTKLYKFGNDGFEMPF